jgi:uncharacterized protein YegP (UPF0339 family)
VYFWIYRDTKGEWRWCLKTADHKIIADSAESFYSKLVCLAAIDLVKSSSEAPVVEHK